MAARIVAAHGNVITVEDCRISTWARLWGTRIALFSPNTVQLRSRMVICGLRAGCGHRVCWVRFAAHLRTLRLTTRGLARARRTGLRRWASFPMAHCQRAPIASRL